MANVGTMRHIKIYEEYSDDELKDLMGDLESIGHKHRWQFGKDFGLGVNMRGGDVTGKSLFYQGQLSTLFFTPEAVQFLEKVGYLKPPVLNRVFDYKIKDDSLPKMRGNYGNKTTISAGLKKHEDKSESPYYFKMFYRDKEFPELYYGGKFRTPTIVAALTNIIKEIEALKK